VLFLYPHIKMHLSPSHDDIYHRQFAMNSVYGAIVFWIAILWLLFWVLDYLLVRFDPETQSPLWSVAVGLLLYRFLRLIPAPEDSRSGSEYIVAALNTAGEAALVAGAAVLVFLILRWMSRHFYQKTVRAIRIVFAGVGICMVWVLPEMLYLTLHKPALGESSYSHPIEAARVVEHHHRIVWVLLDELSYRLAIEAPPPDISLKNFADFRGESYEFTQVKAPSYWTEVVVPSVILGKQINGVHSNADGMLWYHAANEGWTKFDEGNSLFADARRKGWTIGLDGYFNPYCRIMPTVLDRCSWFRETMNLSQMSGSWSTLQNIISPALHFTEGFKPEDRTAARQPEGDHIYILDEQVQAANELLDDSRLKFLFIHLAVPHSPGSFVVEGSRGRNNTYKENLQLADKIFGELRQRIAQEDNGDQTTIVLTSDHSWRTWYWRVSTFWSKADEAFSKVPGNYDERPVLMVHLPGETENHRVNARISEVKEHEMFEDMLHKDSFNDADMWSFVSRNETAAP
jgi:hypothetical protein